MAGRYLATELQDDNGDVIYPHTEANIVFTSDGKTVEEQLGGEVTDADVQEIFANNQPETSNKLSVKEKIKNTFKKYQALLGMKILDTVEEIEANTDEGYLMGARAGAELINDLTAMTDSGAIKGMDAREDGVYITYVPAGGADSVRKKLGSGGTTTLTINRNYNGNGAYYLTILLKINGITIFNTTAPVHDGTIFSETTDWEE